jgi:hypothetical protein
MAFSLITWFASYNLLFYYASVQAGKEPQGGDQPGRAGEQPAGLQEALLLIKERLRTVLGAEKANGLLSSDVRVKGIEIEFYQSPTFLNAGFVGYPEVHGKNDGSITTVGTADHGRIFIVEGKVTTDEAEITAARFLGGVDNRRLVTTVYTSAGGIIEEYAADGILYTYEGELGDPELLLSAARSQLGTLVDGIVFGERQHYWDDPRPS